MRSHDFFLRAHMVAACSSNELEIASKCLAQHGYVVLQQVFLARDVQTLAEQLGSTLQDRSEASVLRSRGRVYGSRNLLETFPQVVSLLKHQELARLIQAILGPAAGIVRVLYFDKPPDRSWSLPWHKDLTIAVKRHDIPTDLFRKRTFKAGIPHVEAPAAVLEAMLTVRIHLDDMTDANGPLYVIPGSHVQPSAEEESSIQLRARAGDVLLMRPLLSHCSISSHPASTAHRRVLHFELSGHAALPDGYDWYWFVPLDPSSPCPPPPAND